MKRFKCKECGYIHIGDEAPATCPVCGFDSEVFYEMIDTSASQDSGYIDMIDNAGDNTINLLRQKFDSKYEKQEEYKASKNKRLENENKKKHYSR